jgi:DNA-binding SARP family transcriptional activator
VEVGGRPLDLRARKQRALLALLLIRVGEAVQPDVIIDALWPDGPPERALNAVQVYVSGLRKLLGPAAGVLQTRPAGYAAVLEPDGLDRDRFERLVASGRAALDQEDPTGAAATLREALALWRGDPLTEFRYEPFAQGEISRLEEVRLAALEERIEADLALGRQGDLAGELEALVAAHPLRERLRGQLMLALYRAGRQAEALAAYQDARRVLVEELGIEPSPPLRELEAAILRQDRSLTLPAGTAPAPAERRAPAEPEPQPPPGIAARKTVTALVWRHSARGGAGEGLDPEARQRVHGRCLELAASVFERYGATPEPLIGDAVVAIFGLPQLHEDDAVRAVRAAAELRDALPALSDELERAWGVRLDARMGIDTGEVLVEEGPDGPAGISGEPVDAAARLEQSADAGQIVLGTGTYALVRDGVTAVPLVAEPDEGAVAGAYELVSLEPAAAGTPRLDSPLVGREHERSLLERAFERATREQNCHLFTILGPAGVGKSRLVAETVEPLRAQATVLHGRCLPYGEGITFWPVVELLGQAAGIDVDEPADQALARIAALVEGEEDRERIVARLGELLGAVDAASATEDAFWAVRRLFETIARNGPVVVVWDDVQWAEPTFLDLVEHVADWSREAAILVVCLARPELLELRPAWGGGKVNATSILLEPLSEKDAGELVANLLGGAELTSAARAKIVAASEGNPLFVEETLVMLIDEGVLRSEADGWRQAEDVRTLSVPATIHALLAARLDRLEPVERSLLTRAAVIGTRFSPGALALLAGDLPEDAVERALAGLVRKELLRPARSDPLGDGYRFRHMLIRDAAYASLPKWQRAELHERAAEWLDARPGEYDEIVGYHLEQAFRYGSELGRHDGHEAALAERAALLLAAAGRRAFARGDMGAAATLIERAAALWGVERPERVELLPLLVKAVRETGELARADALAGEAVEAARGAGDLRVEQLVLIERASLRDYIDPASTLDELAAAAREATAVFRELGDDHGLAEASRLLAEVHWTRGEYAAAEEVLERALGHAERGGERRAAASLLTFTARALLLGPVPVEAALARCRALLDHDAADRTVEAPVFSASAWLHAMRGDFVEARRLCARSRALYEEFGLTTALAGLSLFSGPVELLAGDPVAAEVELRRGLDLLERMGDRSRRSTVAAFLAAALAEQGRTEEAEALSIMAADAALSHDAHTQIAWRGPRARALARRGANTDAERLAREAVALAESTDSPSVQGDALLDLATVLAQADRADDAADAAAEAARRYRAKGNVVSTARAEALARSSAAAGRRP